MEENEEEEEEEEEQEEQEEAIYLRHRVVSMRLAGRQQCHHRAIEASSQRGEMRSLQRLRAN